jgi:predicted transcriptional regulator
MRFTYTVNVDVERVTGKFASRDELGDEVREWLEEANQGTISTEAEAEYEVTDWDVQ